MSARSPKRARVYRPSHPSIRNVLQWSEIVRDRAEEYQQTPDAETKRVLQMGLTALQGVIRLVHILEIDTSDDMEMELMQRVIVIMQCAFRLLQV